MTAPDHRSPAPFKNLLHRRGHPHMCHKSNCMFRAFLRAQHGHRGKFLTRARTSRLRMVAIELGMCRSVRIGSAPGSVIGGKLKLREPSGSTWS
jgi:hypothetical protein